MNSVSLIGNIATSLSLRTTKTKKSVVSFNLAVHRLGGEETDFIPVTA
jgi:single-stranded DNA-binding protein